MMPASGRAASQTTRPPLASDMPPPRSSTLDAARAIASLSRPSTRRCPLEVAVVAKPSRSLAKLRTRAREIQRPSLLMCAARRYPSGNSPSRWGLLQAGNDVRDEPNNGECLVRAAIEERSVFEPLALPELQPEPEELPVHARHRPD